MKLYKPLLLILGSLSLMVFMASCSQSSAPSSASLDSQFASVPAEEALERWQGALTQTTSVDDQDYIDLLLKRSKTKKGKWENVSPRERGNGNKTGHDNQALVTTESATDPIIMAHYMPWFQTPEESGYWGIHWTMANCNPDNQDASGRREICSHHYPLTGPYDSSDADLLEYHALLMKLSGIDGVFIDWYGTQNAFDWPVLKAATEKIMDTFDRYGLKYAIVYEDKTIEAALHFNLIQDDIAAASADFQYLQTAVFTRSNYLHVNNQPLLLNFGPVHFDQASDWTSIFTSASSTPHYQGLWSVSGLSDQFFSWIYNDSQFLPWFYSQVNSWDVSIGEAYPMFDDYYLEGGWSENLFELDSQNKTLFSQTFQEALAAGVQIIQLNTWNDFGEGTDIEPSIENGYQYLTELQSFTGVPFDQADLEAATEFYFLRKRMADNGLILGSSQAIITALLSGDSRTASSLMQ
ncbi:MAG: hypothetical protein KC422_18180 [Trueperaceae bacterium]|nr:hypothetical protein [Trueperaceae bacterium]